MSEENIMEGIHKAIFAALANKVQHIGNVLAKDSRELATKLDIRAFDDFYEGIDAIVEASQKMISLILGSDVAHEPYVLGGKAPSWTPIKPLIAWVEKKALSWVDKETNEPLSVKQMAYMIRAKIKREGSHWSEGRNIFKMVFEKREEWIYKELDNLQVAI